MFITEEDYKVVIGDGALKVISQSSEEVKNKAEAQALAEISNYLRPKYDCSSIFKTQGEERDDLLLMYACDIALFHMVCSQPARMGYELRKERYDMAIKWLEKVQAGKVTPDLPLATDEYGAPLGEPIMYGSEKQHQTIW